MNNYTLYKLSEGFIITSDEKIKENNLIWRQGIKPTLYTNNFWFDFGVPYLKVIAQQDQIDFSELSVEEQKKIKTPIKVEGYFENNLFKITKIWENY